MTSGAGSEAAINTEPTQVILGVIIWYVMKNIPTSSGYTPAVWGFFGHFGACNDHNINIVHNYLHQYSICINLVNIKLQPSAICLSWKLGVADLTVHSKKKTYPASFGS